LTTIIVEQLLYTPLQFSLWKFLMFTGGDGGFIVFNTTFNNISVILWRSNLQDISTYYQDFYCLQVLTKLWVVELW